LSIDILSSGRTKEQLGYIGKSTSV